MSGSSHHPFDNDDQAHRVRGQSTVSHAGVHRAPEAPDAWTDLVPGPGQRALDVQLPPGGPVLTPGAAGALLRLLRRAGSDASSTTGLQR